MIFKDIAHVIALLNVVAACLLGAGVGFIASRVLRLQWGVKQGAVDMLLAAVVVLVSVSIAVAVDTSRGVLESRVTLILLVVVIAVVSRHAVRFVLRRPH
jgi:hypothetical protein